MSTNTKRWKFLFAKKIKTNDNNNDDDDKLIHFKAVVKSAIIDICPFHIFALPKSALRANANDIFCENEQRSHQQ